MGDLKPYIIRRDGTVVDRERDEVIGIVPMQRGTKARDRFGDAYRRRDQAAAALWRTYEENRNERAHDRQQERDRLGETGPTNTERDLRDAGRKT